MTPTATSPAYHATSFDASHAASVDPVDDGHAVDAAETVDASPPSNVSAVTLLALIGGAMAVATIAGVVCVAVGGRMGRRGRSAPIRATRLAACGAALLASSVLADSAMEHYRGSYRKKAMFVAPPAAAITLTAAIATALSSRLMAMKSAVFGAAIATGLFGTGFHFRNIVRRPGGLSFNNLFYRAPLGAPGALALAGVAGIGAVAAEQASLSGRPRVGRGIGAVTSAGLLGLVAEVGLLHFRGAFHNRLMVLPIVCLPLTAAALLASTGLPSQRRVDAARRALQATAALGIVGSGLHAYGVGRNMGGFANWTQNLFSGPPIAAPPSLAGIALMGFSALELLRPSPTSAEPEQGHD